ncbi:SNF1-interacting protein [Tulasnella sp. JGI-2019a]|nr:SNF1-interacting protein [Tulasnella sp. JGI-2019a]KAG9012365.1 SNF1-interacting protein [Tulasnella sp. JGI-2019a]
MGNASSKDRHEDSVDYGALTPQGVYTGPQDWNSQIVGQLIVDRKLAPFYRPLEDFDESWDDEKILAARKEPPPPPTITAEQAEQTLSTSTSHMTSHSSHSNRPHSGKSVKSSGKEPQRLNEAKLYRGAVECPICFLYYPPNINKSRCCDQAICTECFVQIKRSEPTPTHLVSDPACCPYCVQDNFGVSYTPPNWRAGISSDATGPRSDLQKASGTSPSELMPGPSGASKSRRKSMNYDSEDIVTIDQIRPDWEAKLNAVKATVARRANRRIIMRQVGDRLIPVGVTSGRIQILEEGAEGGNEENTGRRSRRRGQPNGELSQLLQSMGMPMVGQDLEEILLQEAMRLSLLEHEAEQKKREEEEKKKGGTSSGGDSGSGEAGAGPSAPGPSANTYIPRVTTSAGERSQASKSRGHAPTPSSSSLANAGAAIALGFGNPSLLQPNAPQSRSDSRAHSRTSSRSSQRRQDPSQPPSAPPFSAMAGAIQAASVAGAFVSPSGGPHHPPDIAEARIHGLEGTVTFGEGRGRGGRTPDLPVVVSPSDLFEDVRGTQGPSPGMQSSSSGSPLPTRIEGVTATSTDIPTPPVQSAVATPTPTDTTPPDSSLVHRVERTESSDTDTTASNDDDDDQGDHGSLSVPGQYYHNLPSTPGLTSNEPLLPRGPWDGSPLPSTPQL